MRSHKAEADAARVEPTIEAHLLVLPIKTEPERAAAAAAVGEHIKAGWSFMFANLDAHSSTMVYTLSRATAPATAEPQPMKVS